MFGPMSTLTPEQVAEIAAKSAAVDKWRGIEIAVPWPDGQGLNIYTVSQHGIELFGNRVCGLPKWFKDLPVGDTDRLVEYISTETEDFCGD